MSVGWYEAALKFEEQTWAHDDQLSVLPTEWQRELVALRRLQSNVFNGAYLQFLVNCGRESYVYASRALKKIGALKLAAIIDRCQALVDEYSPTAGTMEAELRLLLPNEIIDREGRSIKQPGSVLPDSVLAHLGVVLRLHGHAG